MTPEEERLMRLVDGALSPKEAAEAASDPAAAAQAARWRAQAEALRTAMDRELDEPVPDRLLRTLEPRGTVLAFRPRLPQLKAIAPTAMAAAASLVVGVFVGGALPQGSAVLADAGSFAVRGALVDVLDAAPSGVDARGVRVTLTVPTQDGGHCRAFQLADTAGLACAAPKEGWRIVALADAPQGTAPGAEGDYRPAGGLPEEILTAIDSRRAGDALGAEEEAAALKSRR